MNIKYSLGNSGYQYKPGETYTLDTDNIQIIPEDIRRYIMNDVATISRAWDKSSVIACKMFLNSLYGSGAFKIVDVIFHDPATIVFWSDGTKTVVKCQPGDKFDPEKGLAMAITKKTMGNTGSYCNVFKKWIKEEKSDGEV